jgi:outer membrane protein OmpA-like peptidoglycan-associated protein
MPRGVVLDDVVGMAEATERRPARMARRRAQSVADELETFGVEPSRVTISSLGKEAPYGRMATLEVVPARAVLP